MGRPTKLTEDTRKLILQAVLNGLNKEEAACYSGITYQTMLNWEKRAEEEGKGRFYVAITVRENRPFCGVLS